jgi:hypothetical protein
MDAACVRYINFVERVYGESIRDACKQIIQEKEQRGETEFALNSVLDQAQQKVYGNQIEACAAASRRRFNY